jgi:hypothetical protein
MLNFTDGERLVKSERYAALEARWESDEGAASDEAELRHLFCYKTTAAAAATPMRPHTVRAIQPSPRDAPGGPDDGAFSADRCGAFEFTASDLDAVVE